MVDRFSDLDKQDQGEHVVRLNIGGQTVPFAGRTHPGWRPFMERLGRQHNIYERSRKYLDKIPEDLRSDVLSAAFRDLVEQSDDAPSAEASAYLESCLGQAELLIEGIYLADPHQSRDEVRGSVNNLPISLLRSMRIEDR